MRRSALAAMGEFVASRQEFLRAVWNEIINVPLSEIWIDNAQKAAVKDPNAPFADVGPALDRLLQNGASRRDLSLVCRSAAYDAVFGLLYMLEDPGVDSNTSALFESLLGADPSGKEGRPGSAQYDWWAEDCESLSAANVVGFSHDWPRLAPVRLSRAGCQPSDRTCVPPASCPC